MTNAEFLCRASSKRGNLVLPQNFEKHLSDLRLLCASPFAPPALLSCSQHRHHYIYICACFFAPCAPTAMASPTAHASPARKHRYNKALPPAYSHLLCEEEERELRLCVADIEAAVAAPEYDLPRGGRAISRLVSLHFALSLPTGWPHFCFVDGTFVP